MGFRGAEEWWGADPWWNFLPVTQHAGGAFTIEPGVPYRTRLRVVSFDGAADAAMLERLYADYQTPPTVEGP